MDKSLDAPSGDTAEQLDKLMGYRGSIEGTPLAKALDEQRMVLWEAQAIVDMTAGALDSKFGDECNWPDNLPNFPMALRRVSRIIDEVTNSLEDGNLEDRGLAIAREAEDDAEEVSCG